METVKTDFLFYRPLINNDSLSFLKYGVLPSSPAMAAGITSRLWEVSDIVDVLETWEIAAQRKAA